MAEKDLTPFVPYFAVMAMALAIGTAGVVLAALKMLPSPTSGLGPTPLSVAIPKVHYQDDEYLVSVRDPGEWHELREFIQPSNPNVLRIVGNIFGGIYG